MFGKTLTLAVLVLIGVPVPGACDPPTEGQGCGHRAEVSAHAAALAEIERLGGRVEVVTEVDGRPMFRVTTDGAWRGEEEDLRHLRSLCGLVKLRLGDDVSDAALPYLKGLRALKALDLHSRSITDQGLVHLREMVGLERLNLTYTRVTDEGLRHLERLQNLKWLGLLYTEVTHEGVERLRKRLPRTRIESSVFPRDGASSELGGPPSGSGGPPPQHDVNPERRALP